MLSKWQFRLLNAIALVAISLAVANAALYRQNRAAQAELGQRQQFIQQSVALEGLYREMVKALADLALKSNDRALVNMLAGQGINLTGNAAGAAPGPGPSSAAAPKGP